VVKSGKKHLANCLFLTHKATHRIFSPHRSEFLSKTKATGFHYKKLQE
jgi:hypothetical protein